MLDIKRVRKEFKEVKTLIELRGKGDFGISELLNLDRKRREILSNVEQMKNQQKNVSKQIPMFKKEGKDTKEIMMEMKKLSEKIKELDESVKLIDGNMKDKLLNT